MCWWWKCGGMYKHKHGCTLWKAVQVLAPCMCSQSANVSNFVQICANVDKMCSNESKMCANVQKMVLGMCAQQEARGMCGHRERKSCCLMENVYRWITAHPTSRFIFVSCQCVKLTKVKHTTYSLQQRGLCSHFTITSGEGVVQVQSADHNSLWRKM